MPVIIGDFLPQHVNPVLGPLEPLRRPDDPHVIPHKPSYLAPGLSDHDFLVAVRYAAFVPAADLRDVGKQFPVGKDMLGGGFPEHQAFKEAV